MGNPRPRTAVMGWRCANINRLWPPAPGHADLLDSIQCHCYPCAVLLCRAAGSCVITLDLIDRLRSWAIHTRAWGKHYSTDMVCRRHGPVMAWPQVDETPPWMIPNLGSQAAAR